MGNTPEEKERSSAASAVIVMFSTLASRILGFVRIGVVGAIFGASGDADVLNLVFNIPNNLRKLLAEGALSSAFIPVMSRCAEDENRRDAGRLLFRNLLSFQLVILLPILVLAFFKAEPIVNTILAFSEPERQMLAVRLFRPLIQYVLLISMAAVLMGTLNAHSRFLIPSLAPLLFSISVISFILLFHRELGIFSMVWGVLVGGLLQIVVQIPSTRRLGYRFFGSVSFRQEEYRSILRRWGPVVSTSAVFTINQQIALFFASGLADGSGSAMTNALTFWQLPFGIFGASITTVLFPRMSREAADRDLSRLAGTVTGGLVSLSLLLVPSGAGLWVLGHEIISVALQRGAFNALNTDLTAQVLGAYAVGLFSVAAFTFHQRVFYALNDYRTPLLVATVTMIIDVVLSLYLKETSLGVVGLAWANSIAFTVGLILYLFRFHRLARPVFRLKPLFTGFGSALTAATAGVLATVPVQFLLSSIGHKNWWVSGSSLQGLAFLLLLSLPAIGVIILVYKVFGYSLRGIMQR